MGYIQDEDHLINFLNMLIRDNLDNINFDSDFITRDFLISNIYNNGYSDKYTWEVKSGNLDILTIKGTMDFIKNQRLKSSERNFILDSMPENISEKARNFILSLNTPGVYIFKTSKDFLYVGKSKKLKERIPVSMKRIRSFNEDVELLVYCSSASDAGVIESYLISKYNPIFNSEGNYTDELTIDISLNGFKKITVNLFEK